MTNSNDKITAAANDARAEALALIEELTANINADADNAANISSWGHVGNLNHAVASLRDLLGK